jgi:hypothetical protein
MKKRYFAYSLALVAGLFISQKALTFSSGAPAGSSGSPASSGSCGRSGCHGGPSATNQSISFNTNIPTSGFIENTDYNITISANDGGTGASQIGFMASVESPSGHVGAINVTNSNRTRKAGAFITHTFSGLSTSNGQNSWSFDWNSGTAPDQSKIYVSVNYANGNGGTSGDVIVTDEFTLTKDNTISLEEITATTRTAAYPNPTNGPLTIACPKPIKAPLELYDLRGGLIAKSLHARIIDAQHWELSLADLEAGIYLIKDQAGQQIRIVKQ